MDLGQRQSPSELLLVALGARHKESAGPLSFREHFSRETHQTRWAEEAWQNS